MPSLMRFITIVCALAAVGLGAMYSLATFVTPRTREMTVTIPASRLKPPPAEAAAPHGPTTAAEASVDDSGAMTR